jgi:hypothetical protein
VIQSQKVPFDPIRSKADASIQQAFSSASIRLMLLSAGIAPVCLAKAACPFGLLAQMLFAD